MWPRWFLLLFFCAMGCQPSAQSVVSKYQSELEAIKLKLEKIKNSLPENAEDIQAQLSPKLVLDVESPEHNCETIMFGKLAGDESCFNLYLTSNLSTSLAWLHTFHGGGDSEFMDRTMKAACQAKYLIVHRVDEAQLPVAISDTKYIGSLVRIDGFVIDMDTLDIVASYQVYAEPKKTVDVPYKNGEDRKSRLQDFARSSVWTNARQLVSEAIRLNTGGEVKLK
jgi:hypothetical protein